MFQRYLVTLASLLFAYIAFAGPSASAQEAQYAGYASMLERLESVEAQLASNGANVYTSAVGGCQSCDAECGCCCGGGWSKDFEVLFLRFHEADGVDEDRPVDQFGFDPAWRVTVGHTDSSGLSYRTRYFSYDQTATINGENYSVETYNVDFEIAQLIQVSCLLDVEISAGVRYNHYQHDESQTDDQGVDDNAVDQQFEGIGLIIGLSADRQLGCGDLYGRVRHSILVGDDEDPEADSFHSDSIHSQLEIGVGYKVEYCIGPAVAELRLGVEMQNWYTYEDEEEEVGFAGFLVGLGLNY